MRGGRDIEVDIDPAANDRDASVFILGSAFGILLHQRDALVLHASAVARDGAAMAFCGRSGEGKSTFAASMCREGFSFLSDDLCLINLDADRMPVVQPDGRRLKLWAQSIDRLGLGDRREGPVRDGHEKYFIEPREEPAPPALLRAVYILVEARPGTTEGIHKLALPDAMRAIDRQFYRPLLREKIGDKATMVARVAAMARHAGVFRVVRKRGFERLEASVAEVRAHWEGLAG